MSTAENNAKERSALEDKQEVERKRLAEQHRAEEEKALIQQKREVDAAHAATLASEKDAQLKRNQEQALNEKRI